jgi:membrane-associated protease RseP (regulator of RpoE activity)
VIAIGITIALALVIRESPELDNYGAIEPFRSLALAFARFVRASPGMPGAFLYLVIVGIPVTLVHELGHAVVARRRLGGEVRVSVGTAGKIANVRLGQIAVSIKAVGHPGRRAGLASFDAARASAWDVVMIALAGPAASLIGCVITCWGLSASPSIGVAHNLLWAATAAGGCAVLNVIPFEFQERHGGPRLRSDGLVALRAGRIAQSIR